jgi:hypothetical protein
VATIAQSYPSAVERERQFFLYMAIALVVTTAGGFVRFLAIGHSSFDSPWWVHLHGISLMGWMMIYLLQNALVARGSLALHRRLGVLAAAWSLWVLAMGIMVLAANTATGRTPPFFSAEYMIALDMCTVLGFLALTWGGIAMRTRSDWHKRLMLGGTIVLIGPGLGRFVPDSMLGETTSYLIFPGHLLFFLVAIAYDLRTRRQIHPAYVLGLLVLIVVTLLPNMIMNAPPLVALVSALKG